MALPQLYTHVSVPTQVANDNHQYLIRDATWIYAVAPAPNGPFKIGISATPYDRVRDLSTGSPVPIFLFYRIPVSNRRAALFWERAVHEVLKGGGRHLHGEWFNINAHKAIGLLNILGSNMGSYEDAWR